jgi:hypothetical protein
LQREVLFLRHKLQKGLLIRDQEPKEEEMKLMSDYIAKLEGFPDLEVSIIRVTKINKVLKAILRLESIPKEEEFDFKGRSQTLLDKWTKLLSSEPTPVPGAVAAGGVNGDTSAAKEEPATNGIKEDSKTSKLLSKKEEEEMIDGTEEKVADAKEKNEENKTDKSAASDEVSQNSSWLIWENVTADRAIARGCSRRRRDGGIGKFRPYSYLEKPWEEIAHS